MNTLTDKTGVTWENVVAAKAGHVFVDDYENGIRYRIVRGPAAVCAYVGVPDDHPLAGFDYDAIPLDCHGGLTYASDGDDKYHPAGWYWYGWDYAHSGDATTFERIARLERNEKKWTPDDVLRQVWSVTYEFAKLCRLAERIAKPRYPKDPA